MGVSLHNALCYFLNSGKEKPMEIDGQTRVQDILSKLKIPEEMPKIILVNGIHGKKDQVLKEGDVLSVFPPVAGG